MRWLVIILCLPVLAFGGIVGLILCVPLIRDLTPAPAFATTVNDDLGVALPASLTETHAQRQRSVIDPSTFYELNDTGDVATLIGTLTSAA